MQFHVRALQADEIRARMHRPLTDAEKADPKLVLYLDMERVTNGFILEDSSNMQRLRGYMGGVGVLTQTPLIVPSTAPVVKTLSLPAANYQMKASGAYPSIAAFPIHAYDETVTPPVYLPGSGLATWRISSLPDPNVLQLLTSETGPVIDTVPYIMSDSSPPFRPVYDNGGDVSLAEQMCKWMVYGRHVAGEPQFADPQNKTWGTASFQVQVTRNGVTQTISVRVTIMKNNPPILGYSSRALTQWVLPTDGQTNTVRTPQPKLRQTGDV
ncbi:hypothetical protein BJ742DRAFT_39308 [Cladochytrium replicatum]|nr:hypothetical protein BJ742DRAFT_39308 [Cladochytrium replicatum]